MFVALAVLLAMTASAAGAAPAHALDRPPEQRVVGGIVADRAQTPWFALLNPVVNSRGYLCGGTILSEWWILTAAHCVTTDSGAPQSMVDIAGSGAWVNPVSLSSLGAPIQWSQVVVNPGWNPELGTGDIALVGTRTPMATAALPYSSDNSGPTSGTSVQVFGFGATSYGGPVSPVLRTANLLDIGGVSGGCGRYGQWYHSVNQLCAGFPTGALDSCQGDSGGPLTSMAGSVRVAVGVVSYGVECGSPDYPGVYTRVSSYADWIRMRTGLVPYSTQVGIQTPARLVPRKPCSSKFCSLNRGKKIRISMRNIGGTAASVRVTAPKLRVGPAALSVASGGAAASTLAISGSKRFCTPVRIWSDYVVVLSFKVRVNGGRC
ncbi:MAG: serine protease [Actinomycetes bacterium]